MQDASFESHNGRSGRKNVKGTQSFQIDLNAAQREEAGQPEYSVMLDFRCPVHSMASNEAVKPGTVCGACALRGRQSLVQRRVGGVDGNRIRIQTRAGKVEIEAAGQAFSKIAKCSRPTLIQGEGKPGILSGMQGGPQCLQCFQHPFFAELQFPGL